jgi:predicted RNA binding protein YcfA (HicA-like mRNA interferase family)
MAASSREIIRALERAGWRQVGVEGSHHKFRHPDRPGHHVIVPHPVRDMPIGTLRAIERQSGLKLH